MGDCAHRRRRKASLLNLRKIRKFNARRVKKTRKAHGEERMKPLSDSPLYEACHGFKEERSNARFFSVLFAAFILLFAFFSWWESAFGGVIVDGGSMKQTLYDGEKLLMQYAKDKDVKRGEVIVIYVGNYEECKNVSSGFLIKRLIAIEGDKVRCQDGQIEIEYAGTSGWKKLNEPYAYYGDYRLDYDFAEYEVGAGEIFFLGDNRSGKGTSVDSRFKEGMSHLNGLYKSADIYGVVPSWAIEYQETLSTIFFLK